MRERACLDELLITWGGLPNKRIERTHGRSEWRGWGRGGAPLIRKNVGQLIVKPVVTGISSLADVRKGTQTYKGPIEEGGPMV